MTNSNDDEEAWLQQLRDALAETSGQQAPAAVAPPAPVDAGEAGDEGEPQHGPPAPAERPAPVGPVSDVRPAPVDPVLERALWSLGERMSTLESLVTDLFAAIRERSERETPSAIEVDIEALAAQVAERLEGSVRETLATTDSEPGEQSAELVAEMIAEQVTKSVVDQVTGSMADSVSKSVAESVAERISAAAAARGEPGSSPDLSVLDERLDHVAERLDALTARFAEQSAQHETAPTDLSGVDERLDHVGARLDALGSRFDEGVQQTADTLRLMSDDMSIWSRAIQDIADRSTAPQTASASGSDSTDQLAHRLSSLEAQQLKLIESTERDRHLLVDDVIGAVRKLLFGK